MLEVLQHQHDIFNGDRLFVSKNRKPISFDDIRNMEAALKTKPQISESQIHVCQPHKTFSHFYMKTKSKVGSRFVKVKKFTGWCELLTIFSSFWHWSGLLILACSIIACIRGNK